MKLICNTCKRKYEENQCPSTKAGLHCPACGSTDLGEAKQKSEVRKISRAISHTELRHVRYLDEIRDETVRVIMDDIQAHSIKEVGKFLDNIKDSSFNTAVVTVQYMVDTNVT